ncbi:MAG TPA: potassium channel family protein, partial [Mycobacterium sp.]
DVTTWVVWGFFALDYSVRLCLADDRPRWFVRNVFDLAVIVLPVLRQLRLLRLVAVIHILNRLGRRRLRGRVAVYISAGSLLLAFVAALAVLDVERDDPASNIRSFADAMWWACATMTTVGYGDHVPVTDAGRWVGVMLMIGGIALLGSVTATLASWLIEAVRDEAEEERTTQLRAEIAHLASLIEQQTASHETVDAALAGLDVGTRRARLGLERLNGELEMETDAGIPGEPEPVRGRRGGPRLRRQTPGVRNSLATPVEPPFTGRIACFTGRIA